MCKFLVGSLFLQVFGWLGSLTPKFPPMKNLPIQSKSRPIEIDLLPLYNEISYSLFFIQQQQQQQQCKSQNI